MDKEKKYGNVKEEHRRMVEYVGMLADMYVYREMHFKKGCRYPSLMAFEIGYSLGMSPCGENRILVPMPHGMFDEIVIELTEQYDYTSDFGEAESAWNDMSDEEQFETYLITVFKTFEKRFPEYAKDLGLSGIADSQSEVQKKRIKREAGCADEQ